MTKEEIVDALQDDKLVDYIHMKIFSNIIK